MTPTVAARAPLAVASRYAAGRHPVIPIVAGGKIPLADLAPHGLRDASLDPNVLAGWLRRAPDANIAIRCDGLVVLDVDPGGEEALARLEREHGPLSPTREQATPRGGRHLLYRLPAGVEIGNSTRGLGHPQGLDVRAGDRGYIVVAPSRNGTGLYRWTSAVPIADAPAWLIEALTTPPRAEPSPPPSFAGSHTPYGRAALEAEIATVRQATEGQRNETLNASAFALGQLEAGGELAPGDAEAVLLSAAAHAGLSQAEAARTIRSGLRAGRCAPRSAPDRRAREAA